jgi:uncharacterized protein YkwD
LAGTIFALSYDFTNKLSQLGEELEEKPNQITTITSNVISGCTMITDGTDNVKLKCPGMEILHLKRELPLKAATVNDVTLTIDGDKYVVEFLSPLNVKIKYTLTNQELVTSPNGSLVAAKEIIEKSQEALKSTTKEFAKEVQKGIDKGIESSNQIVKELPKPKTQTQKTISKTELYKKALDLVNQDRAKYGLAPLQLSSNEAAQVHADDVLKTRIISHWMTNGEKPYMTYTRYGGTGYVAQNVAFGGYQDIKQCNMPNVICKPIDPIQAMEQSEYNMIFNDAVSNWGHRDNILDPRHTHVSFGFAYDQYSYAFVQNFEDNYIDLISPIGNNPHDVRIIGNVIEGQLLNVAIYYDQYPTPQLYQLHRNDGYYSSGDLVAIVEKPLPPNYYYNVPSGYKLIVAKSMSQNGNSINIVFDMASVATARGVYTITVWLQSNGLDIPATSYVMFVE